MVDILADKAARVLELLSKNDYLVPLTGTQITNATRKTLVDLINAYRTKRKIPGQIYPPNLSTWLNYPDRAPLTFLPELTDSLGLDSLGFDETIWNFSTSEILDLIRASLDGGVLSRVLQRGLNPTLFRLNSTAPTPKGIEFFDTPFPTPKLPACPELIIAAGDILQTTAIMPFDGFLRVIACENGEFIGLNALLKISGDMLKGGQHTLGNITTSDRVSRTFIFAFACTEQCFFYWPIRHERKFRLTHGTFLQLVDSLYCANYIELTSSLQSFVTTMSRQTIW